MEVHKISGHMKLKEVITSKNLTGLAELEFVNVFLFKFEPIFLNLCKRSSFKVHLL
jgi:hypothetical protein